MCVFCLDTHLNKGDHNLMIFSLEDASSRCPLTSVGAPVEVLQHGGVGSLKQPLLAQRGGVTHVHEHSALAGTAVDAAVTDGMVETLILGNRKQPRILKYSVVFLLLRLQPVGMYV